MLLFSKLSWTIQISEKSMCDQSVTLHHLILCVCLFMSFMRIWTKCATTACRFANNTLCLFGSHTPVRTDYIKHTYQLRHTHADRRVLSSLIFHLSSDRLMSSDTAGVDMSPWAVTVVTEDPAPGQAVTGYSPAASLVNVSTISPDQDRLVSIFAGILTRRMSTVYTVYVYTAHRCV